jgi:hypothetical protein
MTFKAKVVQHNTKSQTKDGVDILKVTLQATNAIGGENVATSMTFATRYSEDEIAKYPLDDTFDVTIKPATK